MCPDFKFWPLISQFSAAAGELINSNAQYCTAYCLLDKKDVKLKGQRHSFRTLI